VFRVFWLHWMNSAQREGLLINALLHTAGTPNGDELRRYLLDFDCASLCANNGKALLTYIRGVVDPERRDENTPALSDKLNLVFTGWKRANNTCDDVAEHKSLYLTHLKSRCLFARDIFGCRVMFRLLEMWQSLVSPYIPRKVADAKPLGIEVGFLTAVGLFFTISDYSPTE